MFFQLTFKHLLAHLGKIRGFIETFSKYCHVAQVFFRHVQLAIVSVPNVERFFPFCSHLQQKIFSFFFPVLSCIRFAHEPITLLHAFICFPSASFDLCQHFQACTHTFFNTRHLHLMCRPGKRCLHCTLQLIRKKAVFFKRHRLCVVLHFHKKTLYLLCSLKELILRLLLLSFFFYDLTLLLRQLLFLACQHGLAVLNTFSQILLTSFQCKGIMFTQ